jgi:hypothetical protein
MNQKSQDEPCKLLYFDAENVLKDTCSIDYFVASQTGNPFKQKTYYMGKAYIKHTGKF